jgi:hypothetical protein
MVVAPTTMLAQTSKGIENSVHDFSNPTNNTWNTRRGVCSVCHAAHNTDPAQVVPLWIHGTSQSAFTPYSSPTMQATVGQPNGTSLACLSCHDGSLAINQGIGGVPLGGGTTLSSPIDPSAQIGPDLHTTHPISFTYDAALAAADAGLENPDTYNIGDPKVALTYSTAPVPTSWSGTSLSGQSINKALLGNNHMMQCSSCHDVHKLDGSAPSSGILIKISGNDSGGKGSTICRTCHIK